VGECLCDLTDEDYREDGRHPHHQHKFTMPENGIVPEMPTRVFCYSDECHKGLDAGVFPSWLIGPKLPFDEDLARKREAEPKQSKP